MTTTPDFMGRIGPLRCAALALLLMSCAPSDPYAPPTFPFLGRYHGAVQGSAVLLQNNDWWLGLRDPVLNRLVATALAGSPTLGQARARVAGAEAAFDGTPGLINLSTTLTATGSGLYGVAPTQSSTAQPSLGWLFDPYGAHRAQKNAARAGIEVAEAEVGAARLLLLYNLGNAYVELRYRQTLLTLQDQEMQSRRQTLAMTQTMAEVRDATRLDIARSSARVADLEAQRPGLIAAIKAKANEIAVLAGYAPGSLPADLARAVDRPAAQPRPALSPDVGIPADILRNRPDIQIAERQYYVALQGLTQAEAALYPKLSLIGTLTLDRAASGKTATSYVFGPQVQLPAIPGKAAKAGVSQARANIGAAHANWQATVLTALLEVENAMLDYQAAATSQHSADKAARLYTEALDLTRKVFSQGDATLSDLIDADQARAQSRQVQAQTLFQRGQSFVALNVRLGAGNSAGNAAASSVTNSAASSAASSAGNSVTNSAASSAANSTASSAGTPQP